MTHPECESGFSVGQHVAYYALHPHIKKFDQPDVQINTTRSSTCNLHIYIHIVCQNEKDNKTALINFAIFISFSVNYATLKRKSARFSFNSFMLVKCVTKFNTNIEPITLQTILSLYIVLFIHNFICEGVSVLNFKCFNLGKMFLYTRGRSTENIT